MTEAKVNTDNLSSNRSFARRKGRKLSTTQQSLLTNKLPRFIIDPLDPLTKIPTNSPIHLEIGFGMGEHFISQAQQKPNDYFIGSEPYLNGVANVLKLAEKYKINNILLWPDDVNLFIANIPNNSLETIYLLFPDPWPKKKHLKRRFVQYEKIQLLVNKLTAKGIFHFSSDIPTYITHLKYTMSLISNMLDITSNPHKSHNNYSPKGYHLRALEANRVPQFLQFCKINSSLTYLS